MGGKISIESEWEKGTTMTVVIRFRKPEASSRQAKDATASPPKKVPESDLDRTSVWILLAEDNELNREIVVKLLQRLRFNVKAVENGHRVLEVAKERQWDLVLCVTSASW
jgi:PleD family two-component response regulator